MFVCACVVSWIYLVYFIADVEDERNLVELQVSIYWRTLRFTLHGSCIENVSEYTNYEHVTCMDWRQL